ncbi:S8 family serine peptidase [Rummeliibacillus sp. JY-2-4R]
MFQHPHVDAKERNYTSSDVLISYKNESGKNYIIQKAQKVDSLLNKVKMVRATINMKQYKEFLQNKNIEFINRDSKSMILTDETVAAIPSTTPTYKSYWNLNYVKAPTYWNKGFMGKGVKVAVIDTGVNNIADLPNVVKRVSFVKDDPKTKTINESDSKDRGNAGEGHGTSVAAVIGAQIGGDIFNTTISDVIGVAPNVQLYSLKYADGTKEGSIGEVIEAINWSIEYKMEIINISSSTYEDDPALKKAIDQAVKAGIIIVAAAGNQGNQSKPTYPARYSNVIAVSSIGKDKKCSDFSNTGEAIDFTAPGDYIPTINSHGEIFLASGTSFAAPHVTGLLAVLKERYPYSTSSELIHKLQNAALDLGTKGKDTKFGYGLAQLPTFSTTKPKDLTNVAISNIQDHKATLSYTLPNDKSFSKVAIIVNGKTIKYTTKSSYTLKNLYANRNYKVELKVVNQNGDSSSGILKSFKTLLDITAPSDITNLKLASLKISSATFTWTNANDEDFKGTQVILNNQLLDTTTNEQFSITKLKPDTDYKVRLITEDTAGNIADGIEAKFHTPAIINISSPIVSPVTTSVRTISGKAKGNTVIKVKNGTKTVGKSLTNKEGNFKITIPYQKAGTFLKITAEDSVGNISKAKEIIVKQSNTTAMPIVKPVSTNSKYMSGVSELGSSITIYRGKTLLVSDKVDSKGQFFFYINYQPKNTVLTVYATNKLGIKSKPLKVIVN